MNIVFDLDGTMSDDHHRKHLVEGVDEPDWEAYYQGCREDSAHHPILHLFDALRRDHRVEIWTGRSEIVRDKTMDWLHHYTGLEFHACHPSTPRFSFPKRGPRVPVLMRPADCFERDVELKKSWLDTVRKQDKRVDLAIDDRDRVVRMWRDEGVTCLQVADGAF